MDQKPDQILQKAFQWIAAKGWEPFNYQKVSWISFLNGESGLVKAPTGTGKTFSLLLPAVLSMYYSKEARKGVQLIWISPVRALTKEIAKATHEIIDTLGAELKCGIRTGDTSPTERKKQVDNPPDILITTPESLHQWIANSQTLNHLKNVKTMVVDEWHELCGSKRGVQMELAVALLRHYNGSIKVWAISATLSLAGNSLNIFMGEASKLGKVKLIEADLKKKIELETILPPDIQQFPWAGHLGIHTLQKVVERIQGAESTLIFTNTRSQCEIWYQRLLEMKPDWAGILAMHHSAIDDKLRGWVEEALHEGILKVVVCTSSLDLGVDFRPVDLVVQVGSPKGVARFMQRAGRSGHQPGRASHICFVPTHAMELIEASALRSAVSEGSVEDQIPHIRSFDVLLQFLMTLAVSEGFNEREVFKIVKATFSYQSLSDEEWKQILQILLKGGSALESYEEYQRVGYDKNELIRALNMRIVQRHKMSIGTITSDQSLFIQYKNGRKLGTVEEWFISGLKPGDVFWFAGRTLELVTVEGNKVLVSRSSSKKAKVPAWMGGRMPLSSKLGRQVRFQLDNYLREGAQDLEFQHLIPLLNIQCELSAIPKNNELLIEYFESRDGFHLLVYPFEGRFVHEGLAAILASRIAERIPLSFSMAMNDYGFELLSDRDWGVEKVLNPTLFDPSQLSKTINKTLAETEMVKRKFRDIAMIAGLLFRGYPGKEKKERHLQSSASLLFDVFSRYDPDHLLYQQAFEEVKIFQLEESRLRDTLDRMQNQDWLIKYPRKPTPFALPIIADRLRERLSSEKVEVRLRRMMEKANKEKSQ